MDLQHTEDWAETAPTFAFRHGEAWAEILPSLTDITISAASPAVPQGEPLDIAGVVHDGERTKSDVSLRLVVDNTIVDATASETDGGYSFAYPFEQPGEVDVYALAPYHVGKRQTEDWAEMPPDLSLQTTEVWA